MNTADHQKKVMRVARFIGEAKVSVAPAAASEMLLLEDGAQAAISAPRILLSDMSRAGLLERAGKFMALTPAGRALVESRRSTDVVPEGIGDLAFVRVDDGQGGQQALANLSESPLAHLARRRSRDGKPFLDASEVNAGERLRSDYTRGQIMPRLGANWIASVASGKRGDTGGVAELTEAALAARLRVEKAVSAVGPELSGVLIDICCYLKGFERVEAERGWPARSAKVVLKSALGVLSRHYEPRAAEKPARRVLHWGAEDFRPSIS